MSSKGRDSTYKPSSNEFYPTPKSAITPLLDLINFDKVFSFLEPCRGESAIYDLIPESVKFKEWAELEKGYDYLKLDYTGFDLIVTNPPFSLADKFLEKSLNEAKCVCYLLRLDFLSSKSRKSFWETIGTPDKLLVLSERPKFVSLCKSCKTSKPGLHKIECPVCGGRINPSSDSSEYGWFCYDPYDFINKPKGIHII